MRLLSAQRSHSGGRDTNEDAGGVLIENGSGCWIVADGVGGHGRGDVASQASVRAALDRFRASPGLSVAALRELVEEAHDGVRRAQQDSGFTAMRTTIAMLLADPRSRIWGHVGDTRVYSLREGAIVDRTLDHSVPQMLVDAGQIADHQIRSHPDRNRILRALGEPDMPDVAIGAPAQLQRGDAFLVCSDGWWEHITDHEIEFDYAKSADPEAWLDAMMIRILTRASGEFDNLTAIGVFVE